MVTLKVQCAGFKGIYFKLVYAHLKLRIVVFHIFKITKNIYLNIIHPLKV